VNRPLTVAAILLTMFLSAMEATVVSTAMPTVIAELHGIELYGWVGAVYMLATTVTIPIFGKLADVMGRKPILLLGLAIFLAGSMGSGLARSMEMLVAMRVVQGVGAGALQPVSLTIIGDLFTVQERARIQGVFGAVWGLAGMVGPLVGGLIVGVASWRWVFFLNLPFGLVAAALLVAFYREKGREETSRPRIDVLGALLLSSAVLSLLLGAGGRTPAFTLPLAVVSALLFVWVERRATDPLLPMTLLATPVIRISSILGFLMGAVMMGALMYTPLYVQSVLHGSPTEAGTSVAPMLVGWPLASAFSGRLLPKLGYRALVRGGFLVIAISGVALSLSLGAGTWALRAATFSLGVGMGLANTALLIGVQESVTQRERGVATASTMFFRTIGGAIVVGGLGALVAALLSDKLPPHVLDELLGPERGKGLLPALLEQYEGALAKAMKPAFGVVAALGVAALGVSMGFPKEVVRKGLEEQETGNRRQATGAFAGGSLIRLLFSPSRLMFLPRPSRIAVSLGLAVSTGLAACAAASPAPPSPAPVLATVVTPQAPAGCGPTHRECEAPASCVRDRCRPPIQLAAGAAYSCARLASGQVSCWGHGGYGELGDGSLGDRFTPARVPGIEDAIQVAAGNSPACALLRAGNVVCWGAMWGLGRPTPVVGLDDAEWISVGGGHACAVVRDGRVACWGQGDHGQLGNGTTTGDAAAKVVAGIDDAIDVSCGRVHTCVTRASGRVVCFGANQGGELGDGTTTERTSPVAALELTDALEVSAGDSHTCARVASGEAVCWGKGASFDWTPLLAPTLVRGVSGLRQLGSGIGYTCGRTGEAVGCWGGNIAIPGQRTGSLSPVVPGRVDELAAGFLHACVVDGVSVRCWGRNSAGEIGIDPAAVFPAPTSIAGLDGAKSIAVGSSHSCALLDDGDVFCWGGRYDHALGFGRDETVGKTAGVRNALDAVQVAGSHFETCALRRKGTVECWRYEMRTVPQLTDVVEITPAGLRTCARMRSGEVRCWSLGGDPLRVDVRDATGIKGGGAQACAIRRGGTVACWSHAVETRRGSGVVEKTPRAIPIAGLTEIVELAVGDGNACARRRSGQVLCWGENRNGELGNGTKSRTPTPTAVIGLEDAVSITMGGNHACAVRRTGKVACWGQSEHAALGVATRFPRPKPREVEGVDDAIDVTTARDVTCVRSRSRGVLCWGDNTHGQIGVPPRTASSEPIEVTP
jgi:EmrB/QacA subfamily drug resistance transporter